ncbi:putative Chaperone J-domain superfamily [Helianthus annuus]|nr:putative Chaperone J-domain superfamily [Helianthus annuus]KAJ0783156.1 putative Chaperone J-domain superfamily [Helianthus annuus]
MDEFGILAKDFGFRPQGKSAPMKSTGGDRRSRPTSSSTTFTADGNDMFHDVFGGGPKFTNSNSKSTSSMTDFDYDSIFKDSVSVNNKNNNEMKSKPRVSNSPVYDDDMFDKTVSSSANLRYDDDVFASVSGYSNKQSQQSDQFDDLLGNLGRTEKAEPSGNWSDKSSRGLDDLIPGFGSSSPVSSSRWNSDPSPTSTSNPKEKSNAVDDPFASSEGFFTDPLEQFSNIDKSKSTKSGVTSPSEDVFGDMDSFDSFNKSPPASSNETHIRKKGQSQNHSEERSSVGSFVSSEPIEEYSFGFTENQPQKMPFDQTGTSSNVDTPPKSEEHAQHTNDIWLTVLEIPLFTPVTRDPPPSRPPPPIPAHGSSTRTFDDDFSSSSASTKYSHNANASKMDEEITQKREKADRAAAEKAATEAKEKGAREKEKEAHEKEKEAREKERAAVARAQAEARRRAERAAVDRVTAEARERAAAEARERAAAAAAEARERAAAAAAAKTSQQRNDNDLDSFFSMGSPPNSVPKARTNFNDSATDPLSQDKRGPEGAHRASSSAVPSNVRKASSTANFVDDLSSIFGGGMPAGEFQDVEGETEERRRARLERQQRTQERAAKALAEKNQRDQQIQNEQEERQRISATLDVEIRRWAAGKEGNLRAMLSTLQYVLWPECGWQPVSLTDLITGASVKKVYRKATLCIHPDKVQQKGANLQQKYVAEKVFDLLKEAWNKFNSEELF